jgi:hypothetical protein
LLGNDKPQPVLRGKANNAMTFVPCYDTAQVELRYTYTSQKVENTLTFLHDGAFDLDDLQALAGYFDSWWYSGLRAYQVVGTYLSEIFVRGLNEESDISYSSSTYSGQQGTASGTALPGNVTFCVSFRTGLPGRSYRGRNYTVGLSVNYLYGPNAVSSTYRNAIVSLYSNLRHSAGYVPSDWTWVVASRYHNGVPRAAGVMVEITTVLAVNDYLDSMRRRLTGRGT